MSCQPSSTGWLSYPGAVQLADIKTTDSTVRTLLYDNVKRLVKKFNIDGLRLDAARHVEKDFWKQLKDVGVYTVAEVFHGGQFLLPSASSIFLSHRSTRQIDRLTHSSILTQTPTTSSPSKQTPSMAPSASHSTT